ncbi:DUF3782 domain-containing protein [Methylovulum psychrotolerans]|uniref:DUF3782 domain-containing protein n=1 Tax=Methylovulum psychrotolerans TaxID=1704499 RepID=A0A1Z4C1Z3_9GAMM|nr:DUF3782 domain-containing protein [Methylovulum psychrotolerans]ASF47557.1 DUF3782 domain-containing protein [Methylovulum psychrotolerans]POZ50839.1 hypothetical protein AADEFJLK_03310 [Methylovulum psychrotolerans]
MTDDELKQLVASLAIAQRETAKQFQETDRRFQETDQQLKELGRQADKRTKETDKQLKELGKQIGGLGKKFGSFTEGLALPSMTKILRQRFNMEVVSPSVRVSKNGVELEIDVLAYANSQINAAYVVEVKSHLREEAISQLQNTLSKFKSLFPEHKDKTVYGIIAAVDMTEALKQRVLNAGFYVARIHDDTFSLETPADFTATPF